MFVLLISARLVVVFKWVKTVVGGNSFFAVVYTGRASLFSSPFALERTLLFESRNPILPLSFGRG